MNYEGFVLTFHTSDCTNYWSKKYTFLTVNNDFIVSKYKPSEYLVECVTTENKREKVENMLGKILESEEQEPKLIYYANDQYGYWDFRYNKFVQFKNQYECREIIHTFLVESYIL